MEIKVTVKKHDHAWVAEIDGCDFNLTLMGFTTRDDCMVGLFEHLKKTTDITTVEIEWNRQKIFPSKDFDMRTFIRFHQRNPGGDKYASSMVTTYRNPKTKAKVERQRCKNLGDNSRQLVAVINNEALCIIAPLN